MGRSTEEIEEDGDKRQVVGRIIQAHMGCLVVGRSATAKEAEADDADGVAGHQLPVRLQLRPAFPEALAGIRQTSSWGLHQSTSADSSICTKWVQLKMGCWSLGMKAG